MRNAVGGASASARMPSLRMPTIPNTDARRRVILENCHAR